MEQSLFPALISRQAQKYGDRAAMYYRDHANSTWLPISWNQFAVDTQSLAKYLLAFGVKEENCIGLFSQNMPQLFVVDFAAYRNRAITVPMYATSSTEQVEYILKDAKIEVLFVGEQTQYDIAFEVLQKENPLKQIIIIDSSVTKNDEDTTTRYFNEVLTAGNELTNDDEVAIRAESVKKTDTANILYTSGTTGEPKGVLLAYSQYEALFEAHRVRTPITDSQTSMAFLPLSHIFEKAWSYFCFAEGTTNYINQYPQDIQKTIKEVHPNYLCSVPRFWEKVYEGVQDKIASSDGLMQKMLLSAVEVGFEYNINCKRIGVKPPMVLELKYKFFEKTVFAKLKKVIGIESGLMFPCAGAPLSEKIVSFLKSVGIPLYMGYGLTESCATVSCFEDEGYELGSAGKALPCIRIRIGENSEIQLNGETVTKGYYNKPQANQDSFTQDGWFRTGDAGTLDSFGVLTITDRIKDLFKTANGKYIAPQALELALNSDPLFEQVITIGDSKKFVSALIVPAKDILISFAKKNNIPADNNYAALLKNTRLNELLKERIDKALQSFASFEQVKRFTLLPKPFSMEDGELTNTLKIKRKVITEKYKKEIEIMYL